MRKWILVLVCMVFRGPALAQEAPVQPAERSTHDVEEITVFGQRTLKTMGLELVKAQEEIYSLFNKLNTDDEYDVVCEHTAITGSLIKKRFCMTRYTKTGLAESASSSQSGHIYDPQPLIFSKNKIFLEKMTRLVNSNAQLNQAVQRYAKLREELIQESEKTFGN